MKRLPIILCYMALWSSPCLFAQEEPGPEAAALLDKVAALDQQGKIEEALKLLDLCLEKYKEPNYDRYFTLNYRFILLSRLNRFEEAVPVAEEKANIIRSPKQALCVAEAYLKVNNHEKALGWIETSVERGLQSYTVFESEVYNPLRGNDRLAALVETVKKRNGIGLPAKAFLRESLSGKRVELDRLRGRVVLVDFWATFCGPCLQEMPNLKKCYEAYKRKGFEIIGFSEDQDRDQLNAYLEKNGIPWEIVFCPKGEHDDTVRLYEVVNIPASFLIDRNGIVRHVNLSGKDLERAIAELLDQGGENGK